MQNDEENKVLIIDTKKKEIVRVDNLKLGPDYKDDILIENKEDYLRFYVGSNYEKIAKRIINFPALFIPYFYFLYRKMYSFAIYIFILFLAIITVTGNILYTLPINIFSFFFANKLYMKKVQIGYDSLGQKGEKLRLRGGTSIINIITGTLLMIAIAFTSTLLLRIINVPTKLTEALYLKHNNQDIFDIIIAPPKVKPADYKGYLDMDMKENIRNAFYSYPTEKFIENHQNEVSYNYQLASTNIECNASFYALEDYNDLESLLLGIEKYYGIEIIRERQDEIINNIKWTKIGHRTNDTTTYHYLTKYQNKIYNYQIKIENDKNNQCLKEFELLIKLVNQK